METINEGDVLVYRDSGCEILNVDNSVTIFNNLLLKLQESQLLAFHLWVKGHLDCYTKQICHDFFKTSENDFLNVNTYLKTNRIFLIKNKLTTKIVEEWWNVMNNHYELYDLSVTKIPEKPTFRDSRHDQMIFNFILLKNNLLANNALPIKGDASKIFIASRNRTGKSKFVI